MRRHVRWAGDARGWGGMGTGGFQGFFFCAGRAGFDGVWGVLLRRGGDGRCGCDGGCWEGGGLFSG